MSAPIVKPFVMRDCLFQVDADNYEAHVSQVQFDPASSIVRFKGLTPTSNHAFGTTADWTANLAYAQDWNTPGSLSEYLHEHEGQSIPVTFQPVNGGRPVMATLIVSPGSIGGAIDTVAVAQVALGSTKPQLGEIAPTVPTVTGVSPATVATAGGDMVKLVGRAFTGATAVEFGGVAATEYLVDSYSVIYVVAPAHAAGTVAVTVTNAVGESVAAGTVTYA